MSIILLYFLIGFIFAFVDWLMAYEDDYAEGWRGILWWTAIMLGWPGFIFYWILCSRDE